jgi:hypothetical protein
MGAGLLVVSEQQLQAATTTTTCISNTMFFSFFLFSAVFNIGGSLTGLIEGICYVGQEYSHYAFPEGRYKTQAQG